MSTSEGQQCLPNVCKVQCTSLRSTFPSVSYKNYESSDDEDEIVENFESVLKFFKNFYKCYRELAIDPIRINKGGQ